MNGYRKNFVLLCMVIALIACIYGCESKGTGGGGTGTDTDYTLNGFFVQNVNNSPSVDYLAIAMTRDSANYEAAQLFFDTSALVYNSAGSVYTFPSSSRPYWDGEPVILRVVDSTLFSDTISTTILDSIWFTTAPDSAIPNQNGTSEQIGWSASLGVDGYIIAVVLASDAYTSTGYSAYVTEAGPSTTVPPDAFRNNNILVPGWYNIYVYGYVGSPDAALSTAVLPVPLPTQLTDNISHTNVSGHFGSIVVSRKTMIEVVSI